MQTLKYRLRDAERDFERASDADRPRIQADIDLLHKQIADQTAAIENPQAAAEKTEKSIAAGLEREREPAKPVSGVSRTRFINPPPATAPGYFQDRNKENALIRDFLRDESKRMLTINGRAGIGKTAMVCRLLKALESGQLPDDLGEMRVDGIVYLSAVGTRQINTPNLFADLCRLLPADTAQSLDALYRDPKVSTESKMFALLAAFPAGRVVVLLDNFESVVDSTACCITDAELDEALRALLNAPHHAVKLILTTRVAPHDLALVQPGRHATIHLDEGLDSPYAENILREMDADGKAHLRDAPDALLDRARVRTRGFPRALEALYAILSADRYTTLEEIIGDVGARHASPLPENVVAALVGEAFSRLDPTAQRVMQALAVYARPVAPVAVDYMLQPYVPSVDSAPVLNRLVNMQFVHKEAGKYYLHPVDRDYAMGRVPNPHPNPPPLSQGREQSQRPPQFGGANSLPLFGGFPNGGRAGDGGWTQRALLTRAADYFAQARKPRESWKTLADLEPQLNEFDLRCAAEDYDTAASVLLEIDGEYLLLWGHYRLLIELHERLQGKIGDADLKRQSVGNLGQALAATGNNQRALSCYEQALASARERKNRQAEGAWLGNLGNCYSDLGDTRRAIEFHQQALAIARDIGDKRGEGQDLGNLGNCYGALGDTRRAIEFYQQALVIARDLGDKRGEGADLGNLGTCYRALGDTHRAIDFHQQALAIDRDLGDKRGEGQDLGNLGNCYSALGDTRRAIEFYQQALAIARDIGDKRTEGNALGNLGNCYSALGDTRRAIEFYQQALAIARDIGDRAGEGRHLGNLAECFIDLGQFADAIECTDEYVKICAETGKPATYAFGRIALAQLYAGNLPAARAAAEAARQYDVPQNNHNVAALLGVIALRQARQDLPGFENLEGLARESFASAIAHADALLAQTPELCGSVGAIHESPLPDAIAAYRAARAINHDAGVVARVVRLLDALAQADPHGAEKLAEARRAASGEG